MSCDPLVAEQQRFIQQLVRSPATAPAVAPVVTISVPATKQPEAVLEKASLSVYLGDPYFTPFSFADFAAVIRDWNVGSGVSTNFAAIPLAGNQARK